MLCVSSELGFEMYEPFPDDIAITIEQIASGELRPSKRQRLESDYPILQSSWYSKDEEKEDSTRGFEPQLSIRSDTTLDCMTLDHEDNQLFDFDSYSHGHRDARVGESRILHTESGNTANLFDGGSLIKEVVPAAQSRSPDFAVGQQQCLQQIYTQCADEALEALQVEDKGNQECFGMVSESS